MTKRLKRVSPLQLGIVAGIFYALFSLIIVPFLILAAIIAAIAPHPEGTNNAMQAGIGVGFGLVFAVLAPIIYGAMGFIFGALGGLIYNLVARWTGGIEFVVE